MKFRIKRVAAYSAVGIAIALVGATIYDRWRASQGWCIRFAPDGKERILYGKDCGDNPVFGTKERER